MQLNQTAKSVSYDALSLLLDQAKELEKRGDYECARQLLSPIWQRVGDWPQVDDLEGAIKGAILLRVGSLTRWLGSAYQVGDSMELAKNLATRSIDFFDGASEQRSLAEAHTLLAAIYGRQASYDESRAHIDAALNFVTDVDCDEKAYIYIVGSQIEIRNKHFQAAISYLSKAEKLIALSSDHALKGLYCMNRGVIFKNLDKIDEALIEYAGASFHFKEGRHIQNYARAENNLGFTYLIANNPLEAHRHLNLAHDLFSRVKEKSSVAQVDETRARVFLFEGRNTDAVRMAQAAKHLLQGAGEQSFLVEVMTTLGIALARSGRIYEGYKELEDAAELACRMDDSLGAGLAWLCMLEELFKQLSFKQACLIYQKAYHALLKSEDRSIPSRLCRIASQIIDLAKSETNEEVDFFDGFSLDGVTKEFEGRYIAKALAQTGGRIARAAKLLGLSHQNLSVKLHGKFKHLKPRKNCAPRTLPSNKMTKNNVTRMPDIFEIYRPEGVNREDKLITIDVDYEAFPGVNPNSMLIIKLGKAKEGDPVAVRVLSEETFSKEPIYAVGYLHIGNGFLRLESGNAEYESETFDLESVKIEGVILGYCRAEDVRRCEDRKSVEKLVVHPLN